MSTPRWMKEIRRYWATVQGADGLPPRPRNKDRTFTSLQRPSKFSPRQLLKRQSRPH